MECPTVKIKPTDPEQGEFVVINEEDFDPTKHEFYVEGEASIDPLRMNKESLLTYLTAQGIEHSASMSKAELRALLPAMPEQG